MITIKNNIFWNIHEIILRTLVIFIILLFFIHNILFLIIGFVLIAFIVFLVINKKFFKNIYINDKDKNIKIVYNFKILGLTDELIEFDSITNASFYYNMSRIVPYIEIKHKTGKLRFNCNENKARDIRDYLLKNGIKTNFVNVSKIG